MLFQPGRASEPSRTRVGDGGRDGTFRGIVLGSPGFSRDGEYIRGRARSVEARGPTPCLGVGPGLAAPRGGVATLWPPLRLSFGLRLRLVKLGTSQFVSSNSENISCVTFLKPKTAENRNWHCGILLIG